MDNNWRTVQVFLSKELRSDGSPEIAEVSIHCDGPSIIRCNCDVFESLDYCRHSIRIQKKIEKNDGAFGLLVPDSIPSEVAMEAFTSAESSREFILKHGKIEVI